jgi:hypothetical protein
MPNPNRYDQPAEGGRETVERALQKQSQSKSGSKPPVNAPSRTKSQDNKDHKQR